MALSELTSNLSWYGTNAGFRAQQNVEQTRFNYDPGDLTVSIALRGFDNVGNQSNAFMARQSGNAFNINGQGTATRLTQLGEGTKFPIGPEGQTHEFDTKRTGFSLVSRYGDTFSNKTLKGLAATYTTNSPIDDMYNKFKVRDEVYDPYGYAKAPFILRGIQKDGNSDPERWGNGMPGLDTPRGGITANAERTAADIERIGKFLIRPEGIAFIAKQNILRQMIPNTESTLGIVNKLNPQRLYNPLNTITTVLGLPYGLRYRNFGAQPFDTGISKYEDIVVTSRTTDLEKEFYNRLVLLNQERLNVPGTSWKTISTFSGGPNSIGGIGGTIINKSSVSITPDRQPYQYTFERQYGKGIINTSALTPSELETRSTKTNEPIYTKYAFISETTDPNAPVYKRSKSSLYGIALNGQNAGNIGQQGTSRKSNTSAISIKSPQQGYVLTSWQSQVDFHGGNSNTIFNHYYTDSNRYRRMFTYVYPYFGDTRKFDDNTITPIPVDKIEDPTTANLARNYLYVPDNTDNSPSIVNPSRKEQERLPIIDFNRYRTLSYNQIPVRNGTTGKLDYAATSDDTVPTYDKNNTPIVRKRKQLTSANPAIKSAYEKIVNTSKDIDVDTIWNPKAGSKRDLVTLKIGGIRFIAYITSLSMSDSYNTDEALEIGASYTIPKYSGHTRNVSLSFMVVVDRPDRMEAQWNKLRTLQVLSGPAQIEDNAFPIAKTTTLTVGDIYKNVTVVIESLNYTIDTETPWEITTNYQRPMYIAVDIDCKIMPSTLTYLPGLS